MSHRRESNRFTFDSTSSSVLAWSFMASINSPVASNSAVCNHVVLLNAVSAYLMVVCLTTFSIPQYEFVALPSRPHSTNPLPDIRRRHITRRIALRELQSGSPYRHWLEPRQQNDMHKLEVLNGLLPIYRVLIQLHLNQWSRLRPMPQKLMVQAEGEMWARCMGLAHP